jgi:hypothetical protein
MSKMAKPIYIGYYTPDYEPEMKKLVATLEQFKLEYDITPIQKVGSWVRNCSYKPKAIIDHMVKYPNRVLVYVDCDARIKKHPVLFETITGADIGAHYLGGHELISATLYFAPTDTTKVLMSTWDMMCRQKPDVWDQKVLQHVLAVMPINGLRSMQLPCEYCWIEDDSGLTGPDYPKPDLSERFHGKHDPVIQQTQASRRMRK